MKKLLIILIVLFLLPSLALLAGGKTEGAATTAGKVTGVEKGPVIFYATPAEYEKATGNKLPAFKEAPGLAEQVKEGKLPPVAQRLPAEPLVVKPFEGIGRYGGVLRSPSSNPINTDDAWTARQQPLFMISLHAEGGIMPNALKGWSFSEGNKVWTIFLRKGMKWSTGTPFTADDFIFWYENILLDEEITPTVPSIWKVGGETVLIEKVDDYTVRFRFALPYPSVLTQQAIRARFRRNIPFAPKHWLSEYHIKHNPKANEIAKQKGFEHWWQLFNDRYAVRVEFQKEPFHASIDPWVLREFDAQQAIKYFVRNPYYWKVDVEGQQLPYIDGQQNTMFQSAEVVNLKVIAGELDNAQLDLTVANYKLYKDNEAKGGYRTDIWYESRGQFLTNIRINFNVKDPVKREIFNDLRFRQALSLCINRDEINDAIYLGLGTPRAATVRPDVSFYEEWMGQHFIEYDPERANKLLDEIGLEWDSAHKWRLRPDGKEMTFLLDYRQIEGPRDKVTEMFKYYIEAVGIKAPMKEWGAGYWPKVNANETDAAIWNLDNSEEMGFHMGVGSFRPHAILWRDWVLSDGERGEEPPQWVKRFYEIEDELKQVELGSEEFKRLGKELCTNNLNNMAHIGVIGMTPKPTIVNAKLRNVPDDNIRGYTYRFWMISYPDQWYYEE